MTGMDLPSFASPAEGLFLLISGGMFFSYDMLQLVPEEFFNASYLHPQLLKIMIVFTMISYLLVILGIGFTIAGLLKKIMASTRPGWC
jgi:hypothetical protein